MPPSHQRSSVWRKERRYAARGAAQTLQRVAAVDTRAGTQRARAHAPLMMR